MLNRRRALQVLAASGIGSAAFRRSLAAKAVAGPVSPQMVAEAEWVAGIELTPEQRIAAANNLNDALQGEQRVRVAELDNARRPGLSFAPLSTPGSQPDPRGYQVSVPAEPARGLVSRPDSDEDVAFASIRELGALLRGRQISSVELTKLYLERLHRYDPLLKCVVTFTDELALKQAAQADRELKANTDRGPLHGIPWGMKDVLAYPGYPTTWGAPQFCHRVLDVKAAVAERLDEAGAVLVAKLATNAFAGGGLLWYRGLTRNPWNPRLDAAGSSSGNGSAVAAGLVGFSIATDTAGSIINPSMRCGAVGLRPTYGRVSRFGCMQLCWSLDTIGPICRSADDCGLVLAAIHGGDARDATAVDRKYVWPSSRDVSTIRVGYKPTQDDDDPSHEDLRVLRELGVKLMPLGAAEPLADFGLTFELIEGVVAVESAASFEDITRQGGPKGVQGWPKYWTSGHFLSGVDYLKLNRLRGLMMQRIDKHLQTVDVYLGGELRLYSNLAGLPTVALPNKFEERDGHLLPRSQLLLGRAYDEPTLLALAHACQTALALRRRPPLEQFLAEKDEILKGEEQLDEDRLYAD